ncbi:MAG: glycosyltransferase [Patescibacteria group bacterium]
MAKVKQSKTLPKLQRRRVAVVITVLNEIQNIKSLLDSLTKQSKEIIIVDGGSTDGTWEYLQKYKGIKAFQKIGNRSVGRNFGISKTQTKIIAFTDAGCIPHPNWLKELVKPFSDKSVQVVSGYYEGVSKNIFEKCLIPYVLVMPDKISSEFFPSTRSMAMRKGLGLFDEKLNHNEDYAFATMLNKKGIEFYFAPNAIVSWIPRKDLTSAAWMFLRFAIGDIQAGILRPKVKLIFIRYYAFFFLFFLNHLVILISIPYFIWSIAKNYRYVKDIRAVFWLPVLQITSDLCVIFGTIMGALSKTK